MKLAPVIVLMLASSGCRLHFDESSADGGDATVDAVTVPASCATLPPTCGAAGTGSCCETTTIPGGMFLRSYDPAVDAAYPDMTNPATVSAFRLDRYEVTVGRFRAFVDAGRGIQTAPPVASSGENPRVAGSGWQAAWDPSLPADTATLTSAALCSNFPTWTATPGANETKPANCVSWYVATAFCAWDGGYLPTEAEWNFAAAGGEEQRAYPWSNPPGDTTYSCTLADYQTCGSGTSDVGTHTGTSRWGNEDLAGNVWEWVVDGAGTFTNPCDECATLSGTSRVVRGGSFTSTVGNLRASDRFQYAATGHLDNVGWRCAYPSP